MSDPVVPDPKDDSKDLGEVVGQANEALAEAEAAGAQPDAAQAASEAAAPAIDPDVAAFEAAEREHPGTFDTAGTAPTSVISDEPLPETHVMPPVVAEAPETAVYPSEPAQPTEQYAAAPVPQPIFVQAPEPPRVRNNRGTAALVGLLAAVVFGILYLAAGLGVAAWRGEAPAGEIVDLLLGQLQTWSFWVPVIVFFLGFWLLGGIINRGGWGAWVIFGLVVGLISYGGHILGQLVQAPFWTLTASQGWELVQGQLFAPLAIAALLLGREITIWFGAWVANIGAHKTELNQAAQREYERTLEAGPTLTR